jgi:hypothetical protein
VSQRHSERLAWNVESRRGRWQHRGRDRDAFLRNSGKPVWSSSRAQRQSVPSNPNGATVADSTRAPVLPLLPCHVSRAAAMAAISNRSFTSLRSVLICERWPPQPLIAEWNSNACTKLHVAARHLQPVGDLEAHLPRMARTWQTEGYGQPGAPHTISKAWHLASTLLSAWRRKALSCGLRKDAKDAKDAKERSQRHGVPFLAKAADWNR